MPRKAVVITPSMAAKRKLVLQVRIEALQVMLLESYDEQRKLDAVVDNHTENARPDELELARKDAS